MVDVGGDLFELVYELLRRRARAMFGTERRGHTLQPTAIVHEAYLKLQRSGRQPGDRSHLCALAHRAMREVLVDHARAAACGRRDHRKRLPLPEETPHPSQVQPELLLDLHEAIDALERVDPDLARVAELRCFFGADTAEIAELLGRTERQVFRHWRSARAWLAGRLRCEDA